MDRIKLLALFGESSAGKDSIQHWLERKLKNIHGMVSYTSRPPRDYEIEGREYHFISQEEFEKLIVENKMLEHTCFNNWYYGTYINELQKGKIMEIKFNNVDYIYKKINYVDKEVLKNINIQFQKGKINVGVFNPQGIRSLLSHSDTIDILPVWIQAGEKERLLRSLNREQNPNCAEVCRRFLADQKNFANIEFEHEIFLNDKENGEYYGFLNRPKILNFLEGQT